MGIAFRNIREEVRPGISFTQNQKTTLSFDTTHFDAPPGGSGGKKDKKKKDESSDEDEPPAAAAAGGGRGGRGRGGRHVIRANRRR